MSQIVDGMIPIYIGYFIGENEKDSAEKVGKFTISLRTALDE